MNVAREFHMAVLLSNGKVLVMGGENLGADGRLHDLTSAEIYDPATGQWTETGSMNSPHPSERAALQPNGKVLVYEGGFDGYPILGHELYDPATGTWSVITNK
jgi:N-acetylneuraminic acid mutarotase